MKRTPLTRRTPMRRGGRIRPKVRTGADGQPMIGDPLWPGARAAAALRDGYQCVRCSDPATDVHHRIPREMADPDRHRPERLVSLCRPCHAWVHANPVEARATGYTVAMGLLAELIPVRSLRGRLAWMLNDDWTRERAA